MVVEFSSKNQFKRTQKPLIRSTPHVSDAFAPLNDVRAYIVCKHWKLVLKNNPNYVIFFYEDDIQLQIQVPPPPPK